MVTGTENERRQRRGMARGAVVAALAVGSAAVVLVATMSGEVPVLPREPSASSTPSETEPVDASARQAPPLTPRDARGSDRHLLEQQTSALRVAASATLDRRAAAALARDAASYLATADAASGDAYAAQQSAAANLSRLPLAEFGYRVNAMWPDPGAAGRIPGGRNADPATGGRAGGAAVGASADHARAADRLDGGGGRAVGSPLLWEVGELNVAQSAHALVVGVGGVDSGSHLDDVEFAAVEVTRVWGADWAQQVLVVVPADVSTIEKLLGHTADSLGSIVALTTSEQAIGPTGEVRRIFVNPGPFAELGSTGRRAILTHETVHVATGSAGSNAIPLWFEEGFADAVGFGAVDIGPARGAVDALQGVESGGLPTSLPTDEDFAFTNPEVGANYGLAWIACRAIAERYGMPALVSVYRAALAGEGQPQDNLAAALRDALGLSLDDVVAAWRADLTALTGVT